MFVIPSETSFLISCGKLSSFSTKKGDVLDPKAAPKQHKISASIIKHN